MNSTQTRHTVPVQKADRTLIGTGVDKTLAHVLDNTFVFKAKQDGKVVHYDDKSQLMILQYKDGSKDVLDLRDKLDKNGGNNRCLQIKSLNCWVISASIILYNNRSTTIMYL